jgi:serine/threonine-protein kinase
VIQVGQVLDKYELLERVGQGGMSIVYRATDRSLRRTVAVKILHRHLADSAEARDRFEREAHAVAKLRHENIVEIFAYSGKGSEDSWIVTEFIDGSTLKEFLGDHPLAFPEVAAMIMLQVGRAVAHAHAAGILHRDIKPENVMIRSDGVVKLMDFGISQMVDLQRLTVTGQLLGSPAYMSPEHVEGHPLDFRTDVFACGIVLYQLAVGRLPFEGKNPHEILKRIADCKFMDPRQANPRVGNELGKIILKAMAREPNDRYRDISAMVAALEAYLVGSGLGPATAELARYFQSPASYEMALKERLVDHLVRKGKEQLAINRPAALEAFDRVLTLDPTNASVLAVLEKMSDRRRWQRGAIIGAALLLVAAGAYGARRMMEPEPPAAPQVALGGSGSSAPEPIRVVSPDTDVVALIPDAAPSTGGAGSGSAKGDPDGGDNGRDSGGGSSFVRDRTPDASVAVAELAPAVLRVIPRDSSIAIEGARQPVRPDGIYAIPLVAGGVVSVSVTNTICEGANVRLEEADAGKQRVVTLPFLPGEVTPTCDVPNVTVRIEGKAARLGESQPIPFGDTVSTSLKVKVEFISADHVDTQIVEVKPHGEHEVKCAL